MKVAGLARDAVVATGDWPLLRRVYRLAYRHTIESLRSRLEGIPAVRAVLLRGSARGAHALSPGLSDIDLVVVLDEGASPREELGAVRQVGEGIRSANFPFPLARDVHTIAEDELRAWGELSVYLLGAMHVDAEPLVGALDLPACRTGKGLVRESLLRGVAWWTDRGLRQLLLEPGRTGRLLARRSFEKAERFAAGVAARPADVVDVMRVYNAPSAPYLATFRDALEALRAFDRALPPGFSMPAEARAPHPVIDTALPDLARWVSPLRSSRAFRAAVLSTEGGGSSDLRLYLVLDPDHAGAEAALVALSHHLRRQPLPHRERFSRCPFPIVTTRAALARSVFLRWTALEPIARMRHAETLFGDVTLATCGRGEIARALAHDLVHAPSVARELERTDASGPPPPRLVDATYGIVTACRDWLDGRARTTPVAAGPRRDRHELFGELRRASRELMGPMLEAAFLEPPGEE